MSNLAKISDVIINCVLLAGSLYTAFLGLRLLYQWGLTYVAQPQKSVIDPVNVAVWDVLAEARRITEDGANARGQSD